MTDQYAGQMVTLLEKILAELKTLNERAERIANTPAPAAAAKWAPDN
jgi:hypothetical protein